VKLFFALGAFAMVAACSRAEKRVDGDDDGSDDPLVDANNNNNSGDAGTDSPGSMSASCGDGQMDGGEACDDNNTANNDGCSSACALEAMQTATVMAVNQSVIDDAYNGTLGSMTCANIVVPVWYTPAIASTKVTVGLDHTWVGDLVIKVVHPDNTVVTLVSRPGYTEPADDGASSSSTLGYDAFVVKTSPFTFDAAATTSAEQMGVTATTLCQSDGVCNFVPNNGAAAAGTLASFNTKPSNGMWKLCVGDANSGDTGKLDRVTLTFTH